jgi:hypothetical protein
MISPRVFISYTWNNSEGEGHEEWVIELCTELVANGVDVTLDKWAIRPGESVTAFMEQGVEEADFVLVICTPEFAKKSNYRRGGVGYEQQVVSGSLLSGSPRSKFVPLLRKGTDNLGPECAIPLHFRGTLFIDFRRPEQRAESFKTLLHTIYERPRNPRPKIGKNPFLEKMDAVQDSSDEVSDISVLLSEEFIPIGSSLTEAIDDMRHCFSQGSEFSCRLVLHGSSEILDEYRKLINKRQPSPEEKLRRRDLKNELVAHGLVESFNKRDIDVVEEIREGVELLCKELYFKKGILWTDDELERSIKAYLTLAKSSEWKKTSRDSTPFDFVSPTGHSVVVELTENETRQLEKKVGLERKHLWAIAGLDFTDIENLGRDAIVNRAIPKIVKEYLWYKRVGESIDLELYFGLAAWTVGLH